MRRAGRASGRRRRSPSPIDKAPAVRRADAPARRTGATGSGPFRHASMRPQLQCSTRAYPPLAGRIALLTRGFLTSFSQRHHTDGMVRTQIQLPDQVYARARRVAKAKEISLAELARRGIEAILDQYPAPELIGAEWTPPRVRSGGVKVPLDRLKDFGEVDAPSPEPKARKRA